MTESANHPTPMNAVRIGDTIINLNAVAYFDISDKDTVGVRFVADISEYYDFHLTFKDHEAEALRSWLIARTTNIAALPDESEAAE